MCLHRIRDCQQRRTQKDNRLQARFRPQPEKHTCSVQRKYTESRLLAQLRLPIPRRTARLIHPAPHERSCVQHLASMLLVPMRALELKMGNGGEMLPRSTDTHCRAPARPPPSPPTSPDQLGAQSSWLLSAKTIPSPAGGEGSAGGPTATFTACSPCAWGLPGPAAPESHCSWARSTAGRRGWEGMQRANTRWTRRKMKGRALHMAVSPWEVPHRQKEGHGGKREKGQFFPSYLAFPICPRDFPLPFPLLLKVSLPLFKFGLSNFLNGGGCMSHRGEETTLSREAVPTTGGYPGELIFSGGHRPQASASQRNPLFLLLLPRTGHSPAAPIIRELESRVQACNVWERSQPHARHRRAAGKYLPAA